MTEIKLNNIEKLENQTPENDLNELELLEIKNYISNYPKLEQPFKELALQFNPVLLRIEEEFHFLLQRLKQIALSTEHERNVNAILKSSIESNKLFIKSRIKEVRICVNSEFEKWLEEENNKKIVFFLTLMLSLKLYDRSTQYIRYLFLWDKNKWNLLLEIETILI